jgi:hypothetical protein
MNGEGGMQSEGSFDKVGRKAGELGPPPSPIAQARAPTGARHN